MAPLPLPALSGSPLIVAAPVTRCGTTLLQRLINSSPVGLLFGEGVAAGLQELVSALIRQATEHLPRREEYRRDLQRVLGGEQFWCPHLMPDVEGYVGLWRAALQDFLRFHEAQARQLGRSIWGTKHPSLPIALLREIRALVPGSRIVYLVRDVFAAASSARSRRFVRSLEDLSRFASSWAEGLQGIRELGEDSHVLVVRFEDLESMGAAGLRSLEEFTGARGMSLEVLRTRVNTWSGPESKGHAADQYIAPAILTDEEREVIRARAGEVLELHRALALS